MSPRNGKAKDAAEFVELTNEEIRHIDAGISLLLNERVPREVGIVFQMARQPIKYALVPVSEEHDRLVMLAAKRDKKKQPVREGNGFAIDERRIEEFQRETTALWAAKQKVRVQKISRALIPEKIEGKPFVVAGVMWEWLAPILTD